MKIWNVSGPRQLDRIRHGTNRWKLAALHGHPFSVPQGRPGWIKPHGCSHCVLRKSARGLQEVETGTAQTAADAVRQTALHFSFLLNFDSMMPEKFAVDVRDEHDILMRGNVIDVGPDGHLVVHFSWKLPAEIIDPDAVFEPSTGVRSPDDGCNPPSPKLNYAGPFKILYRASSQEPRTWYSAAIRSSLSRYYLVAIKISPTKLVHCLLSDWMPVEKIVREMNYMPKPARFAKVAVDIPPGPFCVAVSHPRFRAYWEDLTGSQIKHIDEDVGRLCLLVRLSKTSTEKIPFRRGEITHYFEEVQKFLDCLVTFSRLKRRSWWENAALRFVAVLGCKARASGVRAGLTESGSCTGQLDVLSDGILGMVLTRLDIRARNGLRRVSRKWDRVIGTLRQNHLFVLPLHMTTTELPVRYVLKCMLEKDLIHLTVVFSLEQNLPDCCVAPVILALQVFGSKFSKVTIVNGVIHYDQLEIMALASPSTKIFLVNTVLTSLPRHGRSFHMFVKAADFGLPKNQTGKFLVNFWRQFDRLHAPITNDMKDVATKAVQAILDGYFDYVTMRSGETVPATWDRLDSLQNLLTEMEPEHAMVTRSIALWKNHVRDLVHSMRPSTLHLIVQLAAAASEIQCGFHGCPLCLKRWL